MTEGFIKVKINGNEVEKLIRRYKKIKKYMKSSLYEILTMDNNEKIVTGLLNPKVPDTPNTGDN
jgi:hypothetical protein